MLSFDDYGLVIQFSLFGYRVRLHAYRICPDCLGNVGSHFVHGCPGNRGDE